MKNKTFLTVGTAAQSNLKVVERGKVDIPNTHINDPSWLRSCTSIKSDGVKLVYIRFLTVARPLIDCRAKVVRFSLSIAFIK
jgi:hypothetical protein